MLQRQLSFASTAAYTVSVAAVDNGGLVSARNATILIKVEREAFISLLSAATVKKSSKPVVAVLQRPASSLFREDLW